MSLESLPSAPIESTVYQYPDELHKSNALTVQKESLDVLPQRLYQHTFDCILAQAEGPCEFDCRKLHVFNSLPRVQETVEKVAATAFYSPNQIAKDEIASKTRNDHEPPSLEHGSSKENHTADEIACLLESMLISLEDLPHELKEILTKWVKQKEAGEDKVGALSEILDFLKDPRKTELNLQKLGLRSLPEIFDKEPFISTLTILYLSANCLTLLPDSIGKLQNLIALSLSENQLTSLPDSIGKLDNLIALELSENKLISLPDSIGELKQLRTLDLSENELISLPHSIGELKNLEELNLFSNQLSSLPDRIGELKKLTTLHLHGNPNLQKPPNDLLDLLPNCSIYTDRD